MIVVVDFNLASAELNVFNFIIIIFGTKRRKGHNINVITVKSCSVNYLECLVSDEISGLTLVIVIMYYK